MPATPVPPQITPVPLIPNKIQPANRGAPHNIIQLARPIPILNNPHIIADDDKSIANVFCFGAFADNRDRVVYNNLMGSFLFMSLNGSVCFFVLCHYETNMTLATPVAGLDNKSIFNAYKMQFDNLTSKGYPLKINIMDNQATKHIKEFLMDQQCQLQLVEPHNHWLNAAKRAKQTFKDAFIAALATTNSDFPLQLWD